MKKQLLISTLALVIITSSSTVMAENVFKKELKGIGSQISKEAKSVGNDMKTSAKKDLENAALSAKQSKIEEITKQKNEKLQPINIKIAAKKKEIATVKTAKITETERTARLAVLNRELKYLETQKANIQSTFSNKIDALK